MSLQVTAILAAYNEEDIVGAVISHLVAQGVLVHFLDHGSTDATLEEARRFEGRGVIGIEQLPAGETVRWADVLRRKEILARELPGDWFIHHDADEFRESPWNDTTLLEGIRRVDRLGYNAIDFEVLQFRPTHDCFRKGDDLLASFPFFEQPGDYDRLQIKCWKKTTDVAIAASGGHDVDFAGRRVFPVRFLLRHYPVRTQAQGTRKVLRERLPRFDAGEQARGWHRQYAGAREGQDFLRDPSTLTRFDAEAVRARLWLEHRGVEELRSLLESERSEAAVRDSELEQHRGERRLLEAELAFARREVDRLGAVVEAAEKESERLQTRAGHLEALARAQEVRIQELLSSWSWRSTAAARAALKRLRGY